MGLRLIWLSIAALGLSACAGPIETRVVSNGEGLREPSTILSEAAPTSDETAAARKLVVDRLAIRGYRESENGAIQLHVAFAERDAAIAVSAKSGNAATDVAPAKRQKPLQSCADREMRLIVTLTRIVDGTELYRGSAAEYHCKAQTSEVMPALVEAALNDLTAPKGAYRITRLGLE